MTTIEIGFKVQHDCPFNEFSKQFPSAVVSHWCNYENDVLEISCADPIVFESLKEGVDKLTEKVGVKVLRRVMTKPNELLVTQHCGCNHYRSTTPVIEKNHCLELQPTIYRGGWEWYRIIAFSEVDVKNLFKGLDEFCTVEVTSRRTNQTGSVRESFLISIANLLGELTEKQMQALILAMENGYYRVPKKVTTEEIARIQGVPRTTYEEHLRKAESKVLSSVAPYMQLRPTGKR
jgi:predicted DNA binding protein